MFYGAKFLTERRGRCWPPRCWWAALVMSSTSSSEKTSSVEAAAVAAPDRFTRRLNLCHCRLRLCRWVPPLWRLPGREASHTGETTQPTSSYHPTPKWPSLCRARVLYSNRSLRLYHRRSAASRQKKNTTRYIPHNRIDHRHFLISNLQLQALRVATAAVSATERSSEWSMSVSPLRPEAAFMHPVAVAPEAASALLLLLLQPLYYV